MRKIKKERGKKHHEIESSLEKYCFNNEMLTTKGFYGIKSTCIKSDEAEYAKSSQTSLSKPLWLLTALLRKSGIVKLQNLGKDIWEFR